MSLSKFDLIWCIYLCAHACTPLPYAICSAKHISMLNMLRIDGTMHCRTDHKPSRHSGFFLIRFKLTCRQQSLQSSFACLQDAILDIALLHFMSGHLYFDRQTCDFIRQRHTLCPKRSLMLSIPYKIIVGLHRILIRGQLEPWYQTTGRTCIWRTWCNLHCQRKSMPKSSLCEATHKGQWHISLLAFVILMKYEYWQVTRQ